MAKQSKNLEHSAARPARGPAGGKVGGSKGSAANLETTGKGGPAESSPPEGAESSFGISFRKGRAVLAAKVSAPSPLPASEFHPSKPTGDVDPDLSYDWSRGVPAGYAGALSEELATYAANLDRLLENAGDYVLIRKSEICGVFAERGEAEEEGLNRFGDVPVLIKRIARYQPLVLLGGAAR